MRRCPCNYARARLSLDDPSDHAALEWKGLNTRYGNVSTDTSMHGEGRSEEERRRRRRRRRKGRNTEENTTALLRCAQSGCGGQGGRPRPP